MITFLFYSMSHFDFEESDVFLYEVSLVTVRFIFSIHFLISVSNFRTIILFINFHISSFEHYTIDFFSLSNLLLLNIYIWLKKSIISIYIIKWIYISNSICAMPKCTKLHEINMIYSIWTYNSHSIGALMISVLKHWQTFTYLTPITLTK